MDTNTFKEELKFNLTGGVLGLELDDSALDMVLNSSLRELRRYIDTTVLITVPYSGCIDLSSINDAEGNPIKVSAISKIYRTDGFSQGNGDPLEVTDPMLASQWQLLSGGGNMFNFQDFSYNYMAYNTMLQIRNTSSTDLAYKYDKNANKLYINVATNKPSKITIEYIPRYDTVEDITSDYWIDILMRLAKASTKIAVGRIRSRFNQSNALWQQDGNTLLDEGKQELAQIREHLVNNANLLYPID